MFSQEQRHLDAYVNGCLEFINQKGTVRSVSGDHGINCLQMKYLDKELTILAYVLIPPQDIERFCIIFLKDKDTVVLFATAAFDYMKAYDVKTYVHLPSVWEGRICSKYST